MSKIKALLEGFGFDDVVTHQNDICFQVTANYGGTEVLIQDIFDGLVYINIVSPKGRVTITDECGNMLNIFNTIVGIVCE